jgi:hypothetical protein
VILSNKEAVAELKAALVMLKWAGEKNSVVRAALAKVEKVVEGLEARPNKGAKE